MVSLFPCIFLKQNVLIFSPTCTNGHTKTHIHISVHQYVVKCSVTAIAKNNSEHVNTTTTKNSESKKETKVNNLSSYIVLTFVSIHQVKR